MPSGLLSQADWLRSPREVLLQDALSQAATPLSWRTAAKPESDISLGEFIAQAWHVVEPTTPYLHNWHIDAIVEHLEAVTTGEIRNLVINMPPRHMKSLTVSVFWPVWVWTFWPSWRWLYSSYAQSLSTRDSLKCRRIIDSPWYQSRWGSVFQLTGDQNAKTRFENDRSGYRIATSVGGSATGEGGDAVIVDDPHNVKEIESDAKRETVIAWWDMVMSTRLNDPKTGRKVIQMQRAHDRDLSGHVLEQGGYAHLVLPTEYEPGRAKATATGWTDPRSKAKELLWPERFGPEEVADAKVRLGSYGFAGQHQQRPSPAEGGIFQRKWWRFWKPANAYDVPPVTLRQPDGTTLVFDATPLPPLSFYAQSWDMSFKDIKQSDYVCGQIWGKRGADCFLLAQRLDRLDLPATLDAVRDLTAAERRASAKWVEDKANGPAVISTLKREIPGLIAVDPEGDKVGRARAVSPYAESHNVFLPHPGIRGNEWVLDLIESLSSFPNASHDDDVDALTQALLKLQTGRNKQQLPSGTSYTG